MVSQHSSVPLVLEAACEDSALTGSDTPMTTKAKNKGSTGAERRNLLRWIAVEALAPNEEISCTE
jgi:hypothetical protein